ncbi:MAG TPA: protein kinase, partial [Polyangiaceae bacterium]|nr:protein kinase [Polyangiaceae bacterium]
GEVYLAGMGDIEGAERPCVVKLIRKEHRGDASFLARFLDEARIQSQMQHPGVAQILEAALDQEGQPYVVVEHVQGRDLAEVRQRAAQLKLQISWSDAVALVASISDALAHVHERTDPDGRPLEVVHRDLSPQNIMVSYVGETKLIDFGTARGENRRCQTINGIVFAKPGYVAPEVAANNPGGVAADLYALGIVLWELVAGRRFLQGDSREHLAAVAKGERTPPALSLWLAVPRELDVIVAKLTAPRIADRFESAREATELLIKVLAQAPSLANGERSVRARIAHLMLRLYPAEPARSRAEFADLIASARKTGGARPEWTGAPGKVDVKDLLFPGTRYRIVRDIAQGPMSMVHEAHHVDLGRKVALKVLDRQRCRSQDAASRFRHEARVVAQLRHPNLVQIHDFGVSADGRPYYAMEYLEGETLADRLARQGRLPWTDAVSLCVQACQALETAHALGVIHRDIKPANLFVTTEGVVKLLDFGITQTDVEPDRSASESLSLIGTPEYMAPEQIGQRSVDARADIYALGSVLYELVTGQLPHVGANTVTLLDNKVHDKVKPPSQRVRKLDVPKYLDRVLLTALATDMKDRYDNITGMRQDLVWILGSKERHQLTRRRVVGTSLALTAAALVAGVIALEGLPVLEGLPARLSLGRDDVRAEAVPQPAKKPKAALATPATAVASLAPAPMVSTAVATSTASTAQPTLVAPAEPAVIPALGPIAPGASPAATVSPAAPASPAAAASLAATTSSASAGTAKAPTVAPIVSEPVAASSTPSPARAAATPAVAAHTTTAPAPRAAAVASATPAAPSVRPVATPAAPAVRSAASTTAAVATAPASAARSTASAAAPGPSRSSAAPASPAPTSTARASTPAAPSPAPARASAPEKALVAAENLIGRRNLEALEAYRELGSRYPRDPKVLQGWSRVAASTQWWGESLKIAERWASVDKSAPAQIHLARTQRRLGQTDKAIDTLKALLERSPKDEDAQELLSIYVGSKLALR